MREFLRPTLDVLLLPVLTQEVSLSFWRWFRVLVGLRLLRRLKPNRNHKLGAVAGNAFQIVLQLEGALFIIGWNIVITSIIMAVLKFTIGLRMSEEELLAGDDAVHGEEAY